jgi:hypothetical protein
MRFPSALRLRSRLRAAVIALTALAGAALTSAVLISPAHADSGTIRFNVVKAGFVIGGSAGSGTLTFHGRTYPISIGGISYGFTFGASDTEFRGRVTHIRRPQDVAGVYGAAGAGAAIGRGAQAIVLQNANGATLTLSGRSAGAIVAADLNGLAISMR